MPAQPNLSLIHGLACLQLLTASDGPVGSRDMAQRLGLEHTRVNRLLGTLALLGLAEQTPDRKYRPGPGVHVLAAQSLHGSHLLSCALPVLERLREPDWTVALGVLWQGHVCYLFHARPGVPFEEAIGRHELYPAPHSSIGVLLLAHAGSKNELGEEALVPNMASVSVPREVLPDALEHVRENGFARLTYGGKTEVVSVSVGLGQPPIAAIAISSPQIAEENIPDVVDRLRNAAAEIEAAMENFTPTL